MAFQDNTRRKVIPLTSQAKGSTNPLTWDVPKTGLLAGIYLSISISITGTLSAPNALGVSSAVRKVRVVTNGGIDLINISGAGYAYLLRDHLEDYVDVSPQNQGKTAPSVATFNLDMYLPIALNARDAVGLFMLQNEQTLCQISVEFETDATVATGATITGTVQPFVEFFTVPVDPKEYPPLNVVQQVLEDQRAIASVGDLDYSWPRGNTYVQVLHGYGIGSSGVDTKWSRARLIVNQSEIIYDYTNTALAMEFAKSHGRVKVPGVIPFDMIGTSALGTLGSSRDLLFSALVTDLISRITIATQPDTLFTVRRQLIALR